MLLAYQIFYTVKNYVSVLKFKLHTFLYSHTKRCTYRLLLKVENKITHWKNKGYEKHLENIEKYKK